MIAAVLFGGYAVSLVTLYAGLRGNRSFEVGAGLFGMLVFGVLAGCAIG